MKEFITPEMKIAEFDVEDVLCESNGGTIEIPGEGGEVLPDSISETSVSAYE